jgi:hypothetical protein
VFYGKPLLEAGTLGTKCNVQVSGAQQARLLCEDNVAFPPIVPMQLWSLDNRTRLLRRLWHWPDGDAISNR